MTNLKAAVLLLAIALIWGLFIFDTWFGLVQLYMAILCAIFNVLRWPFDSLFRRWAWHNMALINYDRVRHQLNSWCFTIWLANDQYINAIFKGNEDHSISGRVGYLSLNGNKPAMVMEKVIDLLFFVFTGQKNHCKESIEWDEVICKK